MSQESKQILFDEIAAVTQREGIKKTMIRNAFTSLNVEKMEKDGSNLTAEDIIALQDIFGGRSSQNTSYQTIQSGSSTNFSINYDGDKTRFRILSEGQTPKNLQKIIFEEETDKAVEFFVYNDHVLNIYPIASASEGLSKGFSEMNAPFVILPKSYAKLKYNPETDLIECWRVNSAGDNSDGISSVTTDITLQGDGSESDPLGLSDAKNAEIAGKISKAGINLLDSGNIPEMKTGNISGIYRGNEASNPVYEYSPFLQMTTDDTFAQIHFRYYDGEMSYRAGSAGGGYSALRKSWDTVNLPSPATQTQLETKQDKSLFSALADKWIHFYDSATAKMQPVIKLVTGAINQLEFDGRMKLAALILPPNNSPAVANEFKNNGSRLIFANNLAVESTVAYTSDLPTVFNYTPTGNFTTSQLKTAAENAGLIFNGLHFIIKIGSNNFTCTIDNGALNTETVITFGKRGTTGSISFLSTRTLRSGVENITLMNGNVNSLAMLNFDTSEDFLTIYNNV